MKSQSVVTDIRRKVFAEVAKVAYKSKDIKSDIEAIPYTITPDEEPKYRESIYRERQIAAERVRLAMGLSLRPANKPVHITSGVTKSNVSDKYYEPPLMQVIPSACDKCPENEYEVTNQCRNCVAHYCIKACPKGAISVVNGKSFIDKEKCIKCGKCITVCPYHAIVKTTVPCEEVCPVGAIHKNERGVAEIDFARCIFCGKCFMSCPFGAVMERSQIVGVLSAMKRGEKLVAMVAPAADKQFPGTVEQLLAACVKAGFSDVVEVALGAEETTKHETEEFLERMERNPKTFMTTSCCPAYVNLIGKHLPELIEHVSLTPSPMVYAHEMVRKREPNAKTVFIGPCVAKRSEAKRKGIDFVLSFEELGALFAGRKIDVIACEAHPVERPAAASARNFARSCGVTEAVLAEATAKIPDFQLSAKQINGIDRKTCAMLKLYAAGKLPANFLEVMACPGGCVNGPCSLS